MRPFLQYRGSRPGLFNDLSTGDSYPLRISALGGLRLPPLINRKKNGDLPPRTLEKASLPLNNMLYVPIL